MCPPPSSIVSLRTSAGALPASGAVRRVAALREAAFVAPLLGLRAGAGRDAGRTVFEQLLVGQGDRFEVPYRAEGSDDAS